MSFLILSMTLICQQRQDNSAKELEALIIKLELTDEQDKTIKPMLLAMYNDMQEMRSNMMSMMQSGNRESMRSTMDDFRKRIEKGDEEVMKLLNSEQKLVYKQELDKRQERQKNRRSMRRN